MPMQLVVVGKNGMTDSVMRTLPANAPGTRMTMYEDFFGFSTRPFRSVPSEHFFETPSNVEALETVVRCIQRDCGMASVIAPAGLGKSTLAVRLIEELDNQFEVIRLNSGHCGSRRALLQAISYELNLPHRGLDEGELRIQLAEYVERLDQRRVLGIVVLADEADLFPIRLLEELRLLTNFTHGDRARVSVVLLGNVSLEDRLASPHLASFNQRIGARAYLQPLAGEEVTNYIAAQLAQVGAKRAIFDDSAVEAIAQRSQGIPRLINQVCDHALLLGSLGEVATIDAEGIEEAWADLQRLPMPKKQIRTDAAHRSDDLIEFGSLDDDAADFPSVVKFSDREELVEIAEVEFDPVAEEGPEVELVFQNATNPFDEPFVEEELVIDRFHSLGDRSAAGIRRVVSPTDSEIAAFLVPPAATTEPTVDIIAPSYPASEAMIISRDFATAATSFTANDDRDIIMIEAAGPSDKGASPAASATTAPPAPKRRVYRQLFSQLRREHA